MPALWKRLVVGLTAFAVMGIAAVGLAAPVIKPKTEEKARPDTEEAKPAIDLKKLAGSATLRDKDKRNRAVSANNLKQIGLAAINFADANMSRLPADLLDKKGKPALSWRVLLLPYIEQMNLYQKFKLDEPWDSKHNLALLDKMPAVFRSPRVTLKRKGYTVYQAFTGAETLFQTGKTFRFPASIPDGTSNTIMAVEATSAVPWTKPMDIPFDAKKDPPDFGKAFGQRPQCVMFDGSTRTLDLGRISKQTLKYAIMPADGMPLGTDWD
jgi:hypothetical protein